MGLRSWFGVVAVAAVTVLVGGCTSPGKQFAYKDLKLSGGPSSAPVQPVVGQATTISFSLRNTWNQPLTGVAWELRETGAAPATLATGTTDIPAFGNSAQSFIIVSPTKGSHTYEVVVDPANAIAEEDETNNTSATLTVLVADQDLTFAGDASAPVIVPGSPASTSPSTLTFTLTNTVNPAQTAPAASVAVPFDITLNGAVITPAFVANPASPVSVNADGTTAVSVTLPPTNSAGTFVYTISLWPAADSNGDDSNTGNNTSAVTLVIPAGG